MSAGAPYDGVMLDDGSVLDASPDRPVVVREARAKVNLALAVGPAREGDGLHPISTWMAPIELADRLTVTRLEADRLSRYAILWHEEARRSTPIDWSITKDLAVRAHLLLEEAVGRALPVQLKLEKRVPVGGGLGGGSADAAAMLMAVRALYGLELDDAALRSIGARLGSDVPFFVGEGPAIVEGVGEAVERVPAVAGDVVLLFPEFGCATGSVYRAFDEMVGHGLRAEAVRSLARSGGLDGGSLFNDLAAAAERVEPRLAALRARAAEVAGLPVHVTGSGSTLFAVCPGGRSCAEAIAQDLEDELAGCVAVATRLAGN